MNVDVFNEALELRNKQVLCEDLMKYLSNPDATKGLKYKTLLAKFAKTFEAEFMMFVHTMGVKAGEAFEELHDCCPDCNCNGDTDEPQTPPDDAKFQLGDRVEVVKGIHTGSLGTIVDYDSTDSTYRVKLDKYAYNPNALAIWFEPESLELYVESEEGEDKEPKFPIGSKVKVVVGDYKGEIGEVKSYASINSTYYVSSNKFSMWFTGSELEAYVEPDEGEDEDVEDVPSVRDFSLYDRVEIIAGGLIGSKGTIVGLDAESNLLDVLLDGDEESVRFTPTEVKKLDTETPDENDADKDTNQ